MMKLQWTPANEESIEEHPTLVLATIEDVIKVILITQPNTTKFFRVEDYLVVVEIWEKEKYKGCFIF